MTIQQQKSQKQGQGCQHFVQKRAHKLGFKKRNFLDKP